MKTFNDYLIEKHPEGTVKRYLWELRRFQESTNKDIKQLDYQYIISYLGQLRKQQKQAGPALHAIKKYYAFLMETGQRNDNPAQSIRFRDKKSRDVQLQDLFTDEEMAKLLHRVERYMLLRYRNKCIISFLIYQGLTSGDIQALNLQDINLEEATVNVKAGRKTVARSLKLWPVQVYWLMRYIDQDRPKLLKNSKNPDTETLIITARGRPENGEGIGYLLECQRHLFPGRKLNAKTLRQSVIANLLKEGKDLRIVQAFAGHKYASTTERYKQDQIEQLKQVIQQKHPLQT